MTTELDIWRKTFNFIYERNDFYGIDEDGARVIFCYADVGNSSYDNTTIHPNEIDWVKIVSYDHVWEAKGFSRHISYNVLYNAVPEAVRYINPLRVMLI